MKKIIISLIVLLCMVSQCGISSFAYDVAGREDENTFILLKNIGIMQGDENGNFHPDRPINRAEYTAMILRLIGMEELSDSYGLVHSFKDVPIGHWSEKYLSLAYEMGIIQGVGNGCFGINDDVKYQDAVKILVSALGYQLVAEKSGGYPGGYMKTATSLGLLKKIKFTGVFTRSLAAQLITNALTVDIVNASGDVIDGEDVLSVYHDMKIMTGVVTATQNLRSDEKLDKYTVEISGVRYKTVGICADEFLGNNVKCYVKGEINSDPVIYHMILESPEKSLLIDAEAIYEETTLSEFIYSDEKDKRQSITLPESIVIYYNGVKISSAYRKDDVLKPKCGSVMLKDSDKNGIYDIAIVDSYVTIVLEAATEDMLYDKFGENITLDYDEDLFVEDDKGNIIKIGDVEQGSVIMVAQSYDKSLTKLYVTNNSLAGYINAVVKEEGKNDLIDFETADGEKYSFYLSENYKKALDAQHYSCVKMSPGPTTLNIKLNALSQIADVEFIDAPAEEYGFLINAGLTGGMSRQLELQILTPNNKMEVFVAKEKINVGIDVAETYSVTKKDAETLYQMITTNGECERQIIKYKVDDKQNLSYLYFPSSYSNVEDFSCDEQRQMFAYYNGILGQKYNVGQNTVVFSIPKNLSDKAIYSASTAKTFFSNNTAYECSLYDIDGGTVSAAIVYETPIKRYDSSEHGFEATISYASSPVLYINEFRYISDENGDFYGAISGYQNGKEITVRVNEAVLNDRELSSKLKKGIAIQYMTNSVERSRAETSDEEESLISYKVIKNFNDTADAKALWNYDTVRTTNPGIFVAWGQLDNVFEQHATISVSNSNQYTFPIQIDTIVLEYDAENEEFLPCTIDDLQVGRNSFVRMSSSKTKEVVIY